MLVCPYCKSNLIRVEKSYVCDNRHTFDIAKEGYVNLLPVQKKNSKNPGDNKEMINSRRAFLNQGYYDPLLDILFTSLKIDSEKILLDAGCGEGYYSAAIAKKINTLSLLGFDISKEAVKKASKRYKQHQYFVCSVNDIPLQAKSVDLILTIFAPIHAIEFDRVLKENGKLIIVSAGPNHMKEVAQIIYEEYTPHDYNPENNLSNNFDLAKTTNLTFDICIQSKEDRLNFLKMTPYYWSSNEQSIGHLLDLQSLKVTCDFLIQVYTKTK